MKLTEIRELNEDVNVGEDVYPHTLKLKEYTADEKYTHVLTFHNGEEFAIDYPNPTLDLIIIPNPDLSHADRRNVHRVAFPTDISKVRAAPMLDGIANATEEMYLPGCRYIKNLANISKETFYDHFNRQRMSYETGLVSFLTFDINTEKKQEKKAGGEDEKQVSGSDKKKKKLEIVFNVLKRNRGKSRKEIGRIIAKSIGVAQSTGEWYYTRYRKEL